MEHEDAVGAVVGDSGTRPVRKLIWQSPIVSGAVPLSEDLNKAIWGPDARSVVNGTVETVYVGDELVAVTDRDPKYRLDLNEIKPCAPVHCPSFEEMIIDVTHTSEIDQLAARAYRAFAAQLLVDVPAFEDLDVNVRIGWWEAVKQVIEDVEK